MVLIILAHYCEQKEKKNTGNILSEEDCEFIGCSCWENK